MLRLLVISCLVAVGLGAALPKIHKRVLRSNPLFPSGRIVGGSDADIKDLPWQIQLEWDGFQFCGGSIISETYILCAAHCVVDFSASEVTIRSGSSKHEQGGTLTKVKRLQANPAYDEFYYDYDVSVIELAEPIKLSDTAKAIKLATKEPKGGDIVVVSGWGDLEEGDNQGSEQLQSVEVPVVSRVECEKAYDGINDITARMICAGEAGKDSCQGDSGGPVVLGDAIVGIVSWGLGCAEPGYPGVYTNVADLEILKFIRDETGISV